MKTLIIHPEWGGLGDHLFFSHIPRIAKKSGYGRVLISNQAPYRSLEYKTLVWEQNPFVDGFTDDPGVTYKGGDIPDTCNLLDHIMFHFGLDDGQRWHDPEIFYCPKPVAELLQSPTTVADLNFISYVGHLQTHEVDAYMRRHVPYATMAPRNNTVGTIGPQPLHARDLYEYCDIIYSCQRFVCLMSGGNHLAAALGVPATVLYGDGHQAVFRCHRRHEYVRAGREPWRSKLRRLARFAKGMVVRA